PNVLAEGICRLNGTEAKIIGLQRENHPWCGKSSFEVLAQQSLTPDESRNGEIENLRWEFATTKEFHKCGLSMPIPIPSLVFGSLIQAWDQFSPLPLPLTMGSFVERHVGVSRHRISTRLVKFGKSEQHIGFVGDVHYHIIDHHADLTPED